MSKITLIDTPTATLWYHPDKKIVHHKIHKFLYGEELRRLLTAGADLIKQHGATKWLSDDRENTVVSHEDSDWAENEWRPPTIAAGWKYWAIVRPKKVLGQIGMDRIAKDMAAQGLTIRFFEEPEEAITWLDKQP